MLTPMQETLELTLMCAPQVEVFVLRDTIVVVLGTTHIGCVLLTVRTQIIMNAVVAIVLLACHARTWFATYHNIYPRSSSYDYTCTATDGVLGCAYSNWDSTYCTNYDEYACYMVDDGSSYYLYEYDSEKYKTFVLQFSFSLAMLAMIRPITNVVAE